MIKKLCKFCQKNYLVDHRSVCCSVKCYYQLYPKPKKEKIKCVNCGAETSNIKFCSRSCSAQCNNKVTKRKVYKCAQCNNQCGYKRKYCKTCFSEVHRNDYTTISIKDLKARNKKSFHQFIRDAARRVYANSVKPKCCTICQFKFYEICHINPIKSFDDSSLISDVNSLSNLIALCPNHHWLLDNDALDITPYI